MEMLGSSVGNGGVNARADVLKVQKRLNANLTKMVPFKAIPETGVCDAVTVTLISAFQRQAMAVANPDGRVDPNGNTWKRLNGAASVTQASISVSITGEKLPAPAEKLLRDILTSAGLKTAKVTSVVRTPADQARVMYDNCKSNGVAVNYKMYGNVGDKVVKVYADNTAKSRDAVVVLMEAKILELGPSSVSKHCSSSHYVFDVAPSSITDKIAFVKAVEANKTVTKFIKPPIDPAYHVEMLK